jgi:hypothetical protein
MSPRSTRTHSPSSLTRPLALLLLPLLVDVAFGEQDEAFNEPFTIHAFLPEYRPHERALVACAGTPNARVLAFSAELTTEGTLSELDRVVSKEKLKTKDCRLDLVVGGGGRSGGFPSLVREKRGILAKRVAKEVANAMRERVVRLGVSAIERGLVGVLGFVERDAFSRRRRGEVELFGAFDGGELSDD